MINGNDLEAFGYFDPLEEAKPLSPSPTELVKDFSKRTGQKPNPLLYEKLITEEHTEFLEALASRLPPEEVLKELTDLVYVCYGYALAKGWNLNEALLRVHQNNIGRCLQEDGTVQRREDGKIIKRPGYPKVNLKDLAKGELK